MSVVFRSPFTRALSALAAVAALGFGAGAQAAGTDAGATVSNSFTLDYQVNSVAQTQIDSSGSPTNFTVDRKDDLTVSTEQNRSVTPGQTGQTLIFRVENTGNDNIAYRLSIKDVGTDTFDIGTYTATYKIDDGNGVYDPGVDDTGATAYTLGAGVTADIAPDAVVWVTIIGNVPLSATNGQTDDVILIANSFYPTASVDPAYAETPGTEITQAGSNTAGVDSVLADGAVTAGAPEDVANDGAHSSTGTYTVSTASLTASKTVAVVTTNPVNCATDAIAGGFATPGACVEYVIAVANAAGAATATDIAISDVLPNEVEFVAATQTGFAPAGTLTTPAPGCTTSCTVSLSTAGLAGGGNASLTIRALVR